MCDVSKHTCLIVRKGVEYLVGWNRLRGLTWSIYAYDAWQTRDVRAARKVAMKCGGTLMLFNPIIGEIKEWRKENENCAG